MSVDLTKLPEIEFAPQSAAEIEAQVITGYEKALGRTLQPGDPERLFLESLAYFIAVQNAVINFAGRQNLLAYATGGHLDHLGAPHHAGKESCLFLQLEGPMRFDSACVKRIALA